ncbi:MAG: hypothetical protein A7316_10750 [Candidatus Altiarchaeales archaeon WOR_SM1_86-2]|nr:MAG: hypothetical protein A7316_10750 [Candidatus Altiarchaeales archaeon WOR_SM1_86-2]ODS35580.1 MAG: hypothetical protein A7315_14600 [Candidatus Altiarchaeales archaeon WOR_SM1_79]
MIYLDASVAVKWFKKGEEFENEALVLYKKIRELEINACASEWIILEVIRGLTKSGYSKEKINETYDVIEELFSLGLIKKIYVSPAIALAKNIELELNLYAADSIHLATAIITNSQILFSEDKHLHKKKVKEYAEKFGLEIRGLKEIENGKI